VASAGGDRVYPCIASAVPDQPAYPCEIVRFSPKMMNGFVQIERWTSPFFDIRETHLNNI
jgi:hypothetical protein